MDRCNTHYVTAVGVVHNCNLVLGVDMEMNWVAEALFEKGPILEAEEPSLALDVEARHRDNYPVRLAVRIQG